MRTSAAAVTAFKARKLNNLASTALTLPSRWNEVKITVPLPTVNRTASGASIATPAVVFNEPFNNTDTSSPRNAAVRHRSDLNWSLMLVPS